MENPRLCGRGFSLFLCWLSFSRRSTSYGLECRHTEDTDTKARHRGCCASDETWDTEEVSAGEYDEQGEQDTDEEAGL